VLTAFKTYYETATLETTTDPNLVFNLRAKLDSLGYYDDLEVNRVVAAHFDPEQKQSTLYGALAPVVDRLTKRFSAAKVMWRDAADRGDDAAADTAKQTMDALILFKGDLGAYVRLYTFLSQIFDYGNTAIEKRAIFFKRLMPLLDFGREREGIDLSKIVLTHHTLRNRGAAKLSLGSGTAETLYPIAEAGAGSVQVREKALLAEIIERVNDLFTGELSDQDKLVYVKDVIRGKLLESTTLQQQAANNTKEQLSISPDLDKALDDAIIGAYDAHAAMSTQALNSPAVRQALKDILLNHAGLYEGLRSIAGA